ncbi:MAG TPA: efflux RND transporter periplasmic adaptor subunit [Treponemataceae bacterium]|nr:efflux RND transporter periplasmic adaptor subunit [Treponemataceae bacterium]
MKKPNMDTIIKFLLLALIAACALGVVLSVQKPDGKAAAGSSGAARKPTGMAVPGMGQGGARSSNNTASLASNAITVEALELSPSTITKTIKLNGDVFTRSEIGMYPDTSGKVVQYLVSPGKEVKKGDILAMIDPSRPGTSFVASPVRSTINGTVISTPAAIGQTIAASTPVATVGTLDQLEIITFVPEKYSAVLKTSLPAQIKFIPFPDIDFSGYITQVSPVIDPVSRTVEVHLSFSGNTTLVKPGMFAEISLVTQKITDTFVVPKEAIRTFNADLVVYLVGKDEKALRTVVTTGLTTDLEVQLLSGVQAGDRVIVSGSVSEGTLVRVAKGSTKK